jgi:hypothetical protein
VIYYIIKEICPVDAKFLEEVSAPNWLSVKESCGFFADWNNISCAVAVQTFMVI